MSQADITVGIPFHQAANPLHLKEAIESVVKQTLHAKTIHLLQDGPIPDEIKTIIAQYTPLEQVRHIVFENNMGLAFVLNRSIKLTETTYYARMDADDVMLPSRLEKQLRFFDDHPETDILGSWAIDIDAESQPGETRKVPVTHKDIIKYIWTCPLIHPSVMFKKQALLDVGLYNESIARRQDYELWFRCAAAGLQFANIPEPLLLYRFTEAWFEKNNASVLWQQAKMGWRGCRMLKLGPMAYVGTAFPLLKILLPKKAGMKLSGLIKSIDPRNR